MARKGRGGKITRITTDKEEKDFQELDIEGTKTGESDQSENDSTRKPQKGGITHVGKRSY